MKEKFCKETPLEAKELVDPRYTSRYIFGPVLTSWVLFVAYIGPVALR